MHCGDECEYPEASEELGDEAVDVADAIQQAEFWGCGDDVILNDTEGIHSEAILPVTPILRPQAQLPCLSSRKRISQSPSDGALAEPPQSLPPRRRRLTTKTAAGDHRKKEKIPTYSFSHDINGVPNDDHPLYKAYGKFNSGARRLVSKKVCQHKYRLLEQLKKERSVDSYGRVVTYPTHGEWDTARDTAEHVFYQCLARDEELEKTKRGYAMSVLSSMLRNDTFSHSSANTGPVRITGLPAKLLTYIGEHGLVDVMTVVFPQQKRCELRDMSLDE